MDDWIRQRAGGAPSTLTPDGVVPTADLESDASGESAPHGDVSPDGVPAGDQGALSRPTGRRSARAAANLNTIEGLRAYVAELEGSIPERVAEATRQADEAKAEAGRLRTVHEQADAQAFDLIGDPAEYARLLEIPDDQISNDEYQTRETWKANRLVFRPVYERLRTEEATRANNWVVGTRNAWAGQALAVADEIGLDRAELAKPENHDVGRLMKLAAQTTEARVRAEYAERMSQVERDLGAARGGAIASLRSPVTNGQATGAGASVDDDTWLRRLAGFA